MHGSPCTAHIQVRFKSFIDSIHLFSRYILEMTPHTFSSTVFHSFYMLRQPKNSNLNPLTFFNHYNPTTHVFDILPFLLAPEKSLTMSLAQSKSRTSPYYLLLYWCFFLQFLQRTLNCIHFRPLLLHASRKLPLITLRFLFRFIPW